MTNDVGEGGDSARLPDFHIKSCRRNFSGPEYEEVGEKFRKVTSRKA
jgi:hypothetical protein